jgi:hypothetical protein
MQDPSKPIWFNKKEDTIIEFKSDCHLFIGMPVHSEMSIHTAQSLLELQKLAFMKKHKITFQLMKSSLVTQGRNLCVSQFLQTDDATHLLFIDSDIGFEAESIYEMVAKDKDVISIPYPLKTINWEKMIRKFKETNNEDVEVFKQFGNQYPMKVEDSQDIKCKDNVIEVTHSPTGCMLIKKHVFDKLKKAYPEKIIKQGTVINGKIEEKPEFWNFFDTLHDPKTKTYLGEDFAFCKLWKDIGGKCHALINQQIMHVGEHAYVGKFLNELIEVPSNDNITK